MAERAENRPFSLPNEGPPPETTGLVLLHFDFVKLPWRGWIFDRQRERERVRREQFSKDLSLHPVESETGGRESNLNGPNERTEQITNKASFTVDRLCRQLAKNSTISVVQNSKCDGMMVRNFRMRRRKLLRGGEGEGHLDGNLADSSCRLHRLR